MALLIRAETGPDVVRRSEIAARKEWNPHHPQIVCIDVASHRFTIPGFATGFRAYPDREQTTMQRRIVRRAHLDHSGHAAHFSGESPLEFGRAEGVVSFVRQVRTDCENMIASKA